MQEASEKPVPALPWLAQLSSPLNAVPRINMQCSEIQGTVWSRQISVHIPSRIRCPYNAFSLAIIVSTGVEHHRTKDCPSPLKLCCMEQVLIKSSGTTGALWGCICTHKERGSVVPRCLSVNDEATSRNYGLCECSTSSHLRRRK